METQRIAALIGDVHAGVNRCLAAALESRGIKGLAPSHGAILHHLFLRGEASMKELAAAAKRDKSTVTALVKKLVAAGYVATEAAPDDLRSVRVRLTGAGHALEPAFREISQALLERAWRGIAPDDRGRLVRLLETMEANFL